MKNLLGLFALILALSLKSTGAQIDFTPSNEVMLCGAATVYFVYNNAEERDVIYWDFGDGTGANIANPSHEYKEVGRYTVKLKVIRNGVADSVTRENFVTVRPVPLAQMKVEAVPEEMSRQYLFTSESLHHADSFSATTWYINNNILSGGRVWYTFPKEGEYDIILVVTNNLGCSHESTTRIKVEPTVIEPTGIAESRLHAMKVYPNPANERIILQEAGDMNISNLLLTDVLGKQYPVRTSEEQSNKIVHTGTVPPGLYFLTIKTAQSEVTRRILVQH